MNSSEKEQGDINKLLNAYEISRLAKEMISRVEQIPKPQEEVDLKPDEEVFIEIFSAAENIYKLCTKLLEMHPEAFKRCEAQMMEQMLPRRTET